MSGRRGPAGLGFLALIAAVAVVVAVAVGPKPYDRTTVPAALPGPTTSTSAAPAPAAPAVTCGNPVASLRPAGPSGTAVAPGSYMAKIKQRGRLRVGVDPSKRLFSSVGSTSNQPVGFDIDVARSVAAALLGRPEAVDFVFIPTSERVNVLAAGKVDLVADTFTINCARRKAIDFSTEYFTSGQRLLVRRGDRAEDIAGMARRPVCAATGSTSIENLEKLPAASRPEVVSVIDQADCLVLLQQGKVDGISTDDTILAGMAAQDPNVTIVGRPFSREPYGLGVPKGHPEWTRYVNGVLEDLRSSGRWDQIYDRWLRSALGPSPGPPAAAYAG
ncbi:MAG TPA: glutamate ABC transporter substrate-binding protein [Acidimicrobiales bacterium]|nr:glutamate ABC transporter substrate-binding protein [Acidimicrobiales bacterium]